MRTKLHLFTAVLTVLAASFVSNLAQAQAVPSTQVCFAPQQIDYYHAIINDLKEELPPANRDMFVNGFYPMSAATQPVGPDTPIYGQPYDLSTCGSGPEGTGKIFWHLSTAGSMAVPGRSYDAPQNLCCRCQHPLPLPSGLPADHEKFTGTLKDYPCLAAEQGDLGADGNVTAVVDIPKDDCAKPSNFDDLYGPARIDSTYVGSDGHTVFAKCSITRPLCPCAVEESATPPTDTPEPAPTPTNNPTDPTTMPATPAGQAEPHLYVCIERDRELIDLNTGESLPLMGQECPMLSEEAFFKNFENSNLFLSDIHDYRKDGDAKALARLQSNVGKTVAGQVQSGDTGALLTVTTQSQDTKLLAAVDSLKTLSAGNVALVIPNAHVEGGGCSLIR